MEQICALPQTSLAMSNDRRSINVHYELERQKFTVTKIGLPWDTLLPNQSVSASIWACSTQLLGIWKDVRDYLAECAEGRNESPWAPTSSYVRICSRLNDMECTLPLHHRYKNSHFSSRSKAEIKQDSLYWLQWLNMQMTYHATHALINHPFLYAQRASNHKHGPNMFWRTSSELALLHSIWMTRLINMAQEKEMLVSDPHIGQCAAIAATLHLYHSRTADESFNTTARTNFDTCRTFVKRLQSIWPLSDQLGNDLDRLKQESFSREEYGAQSQLSCDTSLMWAILGYKPPSMYRPTKPLFHETISTVPATMIDNGTFLRPATHDRHAVDLCRPDRNVATSPTWERDNSDPDLMLSDRRHNRRPMENNDIDSIQSVAPMDDDYLTMIDTELSQLPHIFDLDGANFGEWELGIL